MSLIPALSLKNPSDMEKFLSLRGVTADSMRELLEKAQAKVPAEERALARQEMKKHLERFAPDWFEEYALADKILQLPEGTFFEHASCANYVAEKYECTSWIVMPDMTRNNHVLVHKNRDSPELYHAPVCIQTPGKYCWTGTCTPAHAYPYMAINEKGLAIAVNNGEICRKWNYSGLTTQMILRLIVENCATPEEAASLIEELRLNNAYSHGKTGSIFFFADKTHACVLEMCAEHAVCVPFDFGYMIRANAWHLPGMESMSLADTNSVAQHNAFREAIVRDKLRKAIESGGVTPEHCFGITRDRTAGFTPDVIMVCRDKSNSFATFDIDPDFPELSTFYHGCGPSRNTIVIPIAVGAKCIPEGMFSGKWNEAGLAFRKEKGIDHLCQDKIDALEQELCQQHTRTLADAKVLLKKGEKEKAVQLLSRSLTEMFAKAEKLMCEIMA